MDGQAQVVVAVFEKQDVRFVNQPTPELPFHLHHFLMKERGGVGRGGERRQGSEAARLPAVSQMQVKICKAIHNRVAFPVYAFYGASVTRKTTQTSVCLQKHRQDNKINTHKRTDGAGDKILDREQTDEDACLLTHAHPQQRSVRRRHPCTVGRTRRFNVTPSSIPCPRVSAYCSPLEILATWAAMRKVDEPLVSRSLFPHGEPP